MRALLVMKKLRMKFSRWSTGPERAQHSKTTVKKRLQLVVIVVMMMKRAVTAIMIQVLLTHL